MKLFEQIKISETKGGAGQNIYRKLEIQQSAQAVPRQPVFLFDRLIGVGYRAQGHNPSLRPLQLLRKQLRSIHLDIDKFSPGFTVSCESFHKACVTVSAAVPAPYIRVDAVVKAGNRGLRENGFCENLLHFHGRIITE